MADEDLTLLPRSRKLAKQAGSDFYFTGAMCKRQHAAKRYTRSAECVTCAIERASAWQKDNPERHGVFVRKWDANNLEIKRGIAARSEKKHRVKRNAAAKTKRRANPEPSRQSCREWYARNRAEEVQRVLAYQKANPGKVNAIANTRRARKVEAGGFYTPEDIVAILDRQDSICIGCPADIRDCYNTDHVHPIARGGHNWPENLQLLCKTCNSQKTDLMMVEWLERRGGPDDPRNARLLWAMEIHRQLNAVPIPIGDRPTSGIAGMKWSTNGIERKRRKPDAVLPDGWRWVTPPMPNRKRPAPFKRKKKLPPLPLLDNMEDAA